ncbi:MFS transporter [Glutamicibacter sp. TV12E]|uniref:MFS transporter n=1 Tax=Glutamicibacter sp. TV12E TaxID=3446362 RepID=UPI004033EA95
MSNIVAADRSISSRNGALLSFAFIAGAFALGTSENVIAGILPELSASFDVSAGTAGILVTAYAGTVVVAGPILTLFVNHLSSRRVLIGSLCLYLVGALVAAVSPNYSTMLISRILGGLVHTTIMVVFMTTSMRLAPKDRQASAAARITLGLSVATVLGVPIGVAISQAFDWRWAFLLIAILTAFSLAVILRAFPREEPQTEPVARASSLDSLRRPQILLGVITTALAAMAALTLVVYIAPFLTTSVLFPSWSITWIMLAYGIGCILGNSLGGMIANRNLVYALVGTVTATFIALLFLGIFPSNGYLTVMLIVLLGLAYFSTFPALNTWIAQSSSDVSPNLALAVNSSAFNIGIALAGVLGGSYINSGSPISGLPIVAAIPGGLAVCAAFAVFMFFRKTTSIKTPLR